MNININVLGFLKRFFSRKEKVLVRSKVMVYLPTVIYTNIITIYYC